MDKIFGSQELADPPAPVNGAAPGFASGEEAPEETVPMSSLASFVMGAWRTNWEARNAGGVTGRLDYAMKANKCSYDDRQKEKLVAAGIDPRVYAPVTFVKNRSAKAMLLELVNTGNGPLFAIEPTPDPVAPKRVMEMAQAHAMEEVGEAVEQLRGAGVTPTPEIENALAQALEAAIAGAHDSIKEEESAWARRMAKRMERRVWDVMVEGGWQDAFARMISHVCIRGTGVMIGPVMRTDAVNELVEDGDGTRRYKVVYRTHPVFEAVDPYDCYPAPDAESVEDGPLCIRVRYNAADLWRMSAAKSEGGRKDDGGWLKASVNALLSAHPNGGVKLATEPEDSSRREVEDKEQSDTRDCTFEGVRCFAPVRGSMLLEMGIDRIPGGGRVDMRTYYRAEVVVIDCKVVFCRVYDERLGVPVCRTKFYDTPGSWWGESIADKLYMCQSVQNNTVKSLLRNMSVASGPQFWINDASRLVNKQDVGFRPLKTWMFGQSMIGNQGAPMGVLDVPLKGMELVSIFKEFSTQADIFSGIPAYTDGQSAAQGGALRTSSGLAMYMESANRGMKMVLGGIDRDVICRTARMVADWILVNDDDMDIKGDVTVVPVGLIGRIMKAQRDQLRQQLLSMVLNSQYLQQILGPKSVMALLRPSVLDVDANPDDVVPNEERMREIEQLEKIKQVIAAMQGADQAQQGGEEMAGAPPGVAQPEQPPEPQGGVAERRGVA